MEFGIQAFISWNRNPLYGPLSSPCKGTQGQPREESRDSEEVSFLPSVIPGNGRQGWRGALPSAGCPVQPPGKLSLVTPQTLVQTLGHWALGVWGEMTLPGAQKPIGAPLAVLIAPNCYRQSLGRGNSFQMSSLLFDCRVQDELILL